METQNYVERHTISGEIVKVNKSFGNDELLVELEGETLLCIRKSNNYVSFGTKDKDGIYQYLGDLTFRSCSEKLLLQHFSPAIESIKVGESPLLYRALTKVKDTEILYTHENQ